MYVKQRIDILEKEFGCKISEITDDIFLSQVELRINHIIGSLSQASEEGENIPFQTGMVSYADELLRRGARWLYHPTYEIDTVLLSNMLLYLPKVKVFFPNANIDESVDQELKTFFSGLSLDAELQQLMRVSELINSEHLIWETAISRMVSSHQLEDVDERVIQQSSDPVIRGILDLSEPFPKDHKMKHRDEWEYAHNYESMKYADPLIQLYDDIAVAALSDDIVLITHPVLERLILEPSLFSDLILTKDIKVLFRCSVPWFGSIFPSEHYELIRPICEKFKHILSGISVKGHNTDIDEDIAGFQKELEIAAVNFEKSGLNYTLRQAALYQRHYINIEHKSDKNILFLSVI